MAATLSLFRASDLRSVRKEAPAVAEPQLFYDPPYATREEDALAWALVRALNTGCGIRHQVVVGDAICNFVIEAEGRTAGIQIVDEDSIPERATPDLDVCYRFTRRDISERLNDCLYVMALLDPALFDARSRVRARRESSENLAIEFNGDRMSEITLRYETPEPLVEIEGEWLVLDPDETTFETRVLRVERKKQRLAV